MSLGSFSVISIACLAVSHPKQSSRYVWHEYVNDTGWTSKPKVFLLRLINPVYGFAGPDGAVHLSEDCFNPTGTVPLATCWVVLIGFLTALFFTVSMLCSVKDINTAVFSHTGWGFFLLIPRYLVSDKLSRVPIFEIWNQATGSVAATNVFMVLITLAGFLASIGTTQTSSRLT